ncbi:MAG: hypothetical protein HY365_03685 [Candidatus Aenigmarchaeota archaeon]|nr:hypothetical protein [Candidatus Aenigmarchaeota archaeon]
MLPKEWLAIGFAAAALLYLSGAALAALLCAVSVATSILIGAAKLRSVGIEFVTFSAVVLGVTYGSGIGALAALILMTLHMVIGGYTGAYVLWVLPVYAGVGFAAGTVGGSPFSLGIMLSVFANLANIVFTWLFSRQYAAGFLPFAVSNVIFNLVVFRLLGSSFQS